MRFLNTRGAEVRSAVLRGHFCMLSRLCVLRAGWLWATYLTSLYPAPSSVRGDGNSSFLQSRVKLNRGSTKAWNKAHTRRAGKSALLFPSPSAAARKDFLKQAQLARALSPGSSFTDRGAAHFRRWQTRQPEAAGCRQEGGHGAVRLCSLREH